MGLFPALQVRPGFPLPEVGAGLFPPSPVLNDPLFGVNPFTGNRMFGLGASGVSLPQSVSGYPQSYIGQRMIAAQQEMLRQAGLPLDGDPNTWTPDDASAQTDSAIAKIATVNPDLAAELQAQRTGTETGGGFWNSLKSLAGDLFHPFAVIGSKALDILSRPAHVIPALLVNDNDPWYEDIGQALDGTSDDRWADVLEQWGIGNSAARGIVGFVGDVLSDPLTYVTFGMGGAGRKAVAVGAQRLTAVKVGEQLLASGAEGAAAVTEHATSLLDDFTRRFTSLINRPVDVDFAAALTGQAWVGAEKAVWGDMYEVSDFVMRWVNQGRSLMKLPDIATSAGRTYEGKQVLSWFMGAEKAALHSDKYNLAKTFAAAVGGIRLRAWTPFGLRYISSPLPFLSSLNFQGIRRFMAGMSGSSRLIRAIESGMPGVDWQDWVNWSENGYDWALKQNDTLGHLSGRGSNFGSALYSMSEQVGRVTATLTPHAAAYRRGLAGAIAADSARTAREVEESVLRTGFDWQGLENGQVVTMTSGELRRELYDALGGDTSNPMWMRFWEAFPDRAAYENPEVYTDQVLFAQARDALDKGLIQPEEYDMALALGSGQLKELQELKAQVGPRQAEALFKWRDCMLKVTNEAGRREVTSVPYWDVDFDTAKVLNSNDATRWAARSYPGTREVTFYAVPVAATDPERWASSGLNKVDDIRRLGEHRGSGVNLVSWGEDSGRLHVEKLEDGRERIFGWGSVDAADDVLYAGVREEGAQQVPLMLDGAFERVGGEDESWRSLINKEGVDGVILPNDQVIYFNPNKAKQLTRVRVRVNKPLVLDYTEGATLSDEPLWETWYKDAEAADAATRDAKAAFGETDPEVAAKVNQWTADDGVTEVATNEGKDSLFVKTQDGMLKVTVFSPSNVKVIDDLAPDAIATRGWAPRMTTDHIDELVRGLPDQSIPEKFWAAPKLHHNLARGFREDKFEDAAAHWRQNLKDRGLDIAEDEPIYETDVLKAGDTLMHRYARAFAQEEVLRAYTRIRTLGEVAPKMFGGSLGFSRYQWKVLEEGSGGWKHLEKLDRKVANLATRSAMKRAEYVETMHTNTLRSSKHWERAMEALEAEDAGLWPDWAPSEMGLTDAAHLNLRAAEAELGKTSIDAQIRQTLVELQRAAHTKAGVSTDVIERLKTKLTKLRETREAVTEGPAYSKFTKAEEKLARQNLEFLRRQSESAYKEMERTYTRLQTEVAEVRPALVPLQQGRGMEGFVSLEERTGLKEFRGLAAPAYIAEEFAWALHNVGDDIGALRRMWRQWVMGPWKEWATFRFPGFHVRNNMGAWFNNWLGGTDFFDYQHFAMPLLKAKGDFGLKLARKWADVAVDDDIIEKYALKRIFGDEQVTWGKLADLTDDLGIHRANTAQTAGVFTAAEELAREQRTRGAGGLLRRSGRQYDKYMRWTGGAVEDFHRCAAFATGLRSVDGDMYGARAWVMMRQGDYEDLNRFEEGMKDLIPFYKWFRTNTPYQLHMLLEAPGKPLAVIKAKENAYEAYGLDYDEEQLKQPEWMRQLFALPVRGGKGEDPLQLMVLDLPFSDLFNGANEYFSMFLPMVMPLVESYVIHKDTFSQAEYTGELVPLGTGNPMNLPFLRDMLVQTGMLKRGTDGQYLIDDRLQNLVSGMPVFSRFRNWLYAEPDRMKYRMGTLMSSMLGLGTRLVDDQTMTDAELGFYHSQVEPLMQQLRDEGVVFPDVNQISPDVYEALGLVTPEERKTR